jgi:hypothetical protein
VAISTNANLRARPLAMCRMTWVVSTVSAPGRTLFKYLSKRAARRSSADSITTVAAQGWDFGHGHPSVVWAQFLPWGALHVLGGVMGASMFIEDFCPIALQYRAQWFPRILEVQCTGDPAGESFSPHGVATSAVDVLRKNGIVVRVVPNANRVDRRDVAIQTIAGYMRRVTPQGPAFKIAPRFAIVTKRGTNATPVLLDGFEAGYVWDTKSTASTANPSTRRPLKDGFYDHAQNATEYIILAFGPAAGVKTKPREPPPSLAYSYRGPAGHRGPR